MGRQYLITVTFKHENHLPFSQLFQQSTQKRFSTQSRTPSTLIKSSLMVAARLHFNSVKLHVSLYQQLLNLWLSLLKLVELLLGFGTITTRSSLNNIGTSITQGLLGICNRIIDLIL